MGIQIMTLQKNPNQSNKQKTKRNKKDNVTAMTDDPFKRTCDYHTIDYLALQ